MIFDYIKNVILDLLFPKSCLACRKDGDLICTECLKRISFLNYQKCPSCKKLNNIGDFCSPKCKNNFYFDQLMVSAAYGKEEVVQKIIIAFKYKFSEELAKILGEILKTQYVYFSQDNLRLRDAIFVPVPLHKKRLKFRGFNQSLLLANYLKKSLNADPLLENYFKNIEVCDCLLRKKYSKEQAKLSRFDRLKNLTDAFLVKPDLTEVIKNKSIVLIDDVATTCSTLNECSKVLKKAHTSHISGLVVARG